MDSYIVMLMNALVYRGSIKDVVDGMGIKWMRLMDKKVDAR